MSVIGETVNRAEIDNVLEKAKTIVIKIGSAVLTDKDGLNLPVINSLANQIALLMNQASETKQNSLNPVNGSCLKRNIILVSSGSVAAGKALLSKKGIENLKDTAKPAISSIGQNKLMAVWNEAFSKLSILTAQVLLTRDDLRSRRRFQITTSTFLELLSWSVLPIVNENDTVSVFDLKFGDNDSLASLLINLIEADLFINLTSAPGVFDSDPGTNPAAKILKYIPNINEINIEKICGSKTEAGSGGMKSKLLAARRIAQLGVPSLILPGKESNILLKAFDKKMELPGTWIVSSEKKLVSRRKFWLAYQSTPKGIVEIDQGAREALVHSGRSLLPGGITKVLGNFPKGSLLKITHNGENLGVGFCNYDSEELTKICGLKRYEITAILGKSRYPDVIHRDNLLLDAVL